MTRSVVQTLILQDLYRHRQVVLFSIVGGVLALGLMQVGGEVPFVLGATWFYCSLIVVGSMLPGLNVVNERKKQTLPFLMSLPLSVFQYSAAKLASTVGIFLIPWAALLISGVAYIAGRSDIPNGIIPLMLILTGFTLVGFCLIAGVALVSESEGWTIAATVISNSSYGFGWYLIARNPAVRADLGSPVPVWNALVLTILGGEIALVAAILGVTFFLQSRKRDFV
jgi:ABC-type Na+ efflux pump permease subunit